MWSKHVYQAYCGFTLYIKKTGCYFKFFLLHVIIYSYCGIIIARYSSHIPSFFTINCGRNGCYSFLMLRGVKTTLNIKDIKWIVLSFWFIFYPVKMFMQIYVDIYLIKKGHFWCLYLIKFELYYSYQLTHYS